MVDLCGQHLGTYRLQRLLGTGGFSQVYLGEQVHLGTQVAIKVLHYHLNGTFGEHFLREASLLSQLAHPHIIHILDFGAESDLVFLVMEYVSGGTVRALHASGAPLPLTEVRSYIQQVSSALAYVHERHMIHCDLHPGNLLLGADGQILLSDFGLAQLIHQTTYLNTNTLRGTFCYLAPEVLTGRVSFASDQYALAVMAYEWLTGRPPFHGTVAQLCYQHLAQAPVPLRERVPHLPPLLEQVVLTALAKDPRKRFSDVSTFALAFELAATEETGERLLSLLPPSASLFIPPYSSDTASVSPPPSVNKYVVTPPLQPLIGRLEEQEQLCVLLLQPGVRLLTLVGTGGVGKTRLAQAVAAVLQDAFADGVCFVPLATTRTTDQVITAIAQTLGIHTGDQCISQIVQAFLQEKHLLLVLDNFEQVVEAALELSSLLTTCPGLKLLVTSRERLRISGEHEFLVSPLTLPNLDLEPDCAALMQNPAVALFVERAQACKPDFRLQEANALAVAAICVQLDGLPLAIELAAARIKLLPPQALLARLSHRLAVLTRGRRDAPARQQTLRDTIKWSYDLLEVGQQRLFRRICIFVGGCTLQALEALVRELGEDAAEVLEDASSLLDKSLIQQSGQEELLRLQVLETIREFGLERLAELGEEERVRQAHTRYYLSWAQMACQAIFSRDQKFWIRSFVQERGNLQAAMQHMIKQADWEAALRLGGLLGPIWFLWGSGNQYIYMIEGKQFLEQALAGSEEVVGWSRARSLLFYGGILAVLREAEQGEIFCQQGLTILRRMNDLQGVIQGLWMFFYTQFVPGHLPEARQAAEEALALSLAHPEVCTEWGPAWTQGYSSFLAGYAAVWEGRYAQARERLLKSSSLLEQAGDAFVLSWTILLRSETAVFEGNDEEAHVLLEQGLPRYKALGMKVLVAEAISLQGRLALQADEVEQARALLIESLRLSQEVRDERRMAWSHIWLAKVALREQQLDQASHMLSEALTWAIRKHDGLMLALGLEEWASAATARGAWEWAVWISAVAQTLRETTGAALPSVDRREQQERLARLRATLGEARFQALWKHGRGLTSSQVLTEQGTTDASISGSLVQEGGVDLNARAAIGLTRRELDVLRKLADGLTNREIAEQLVLSVATVNSYLRTIYSKLGVSTRAAAVRFVLDHHLFE
jgi:predicted ATPase/serine/threonine protein kinase/DNA-binding CsgD family transcriptional regulator